MLILGGFYLFIFFNDMIESELTSEHKGIL